MNRAAQKQIQRLHDFQQIQHFALQFHTLLLEELNDGQPFSENRARAVMLGMGVLDEAVYQTFLRFVEKEANLRVVLYDLLVNTGITADIPGHFYGESQPIAWLSFLVAVHAYKSGYPLSQLDPSSPPATHTPAGMMLQQAAGFMRTQVQRSATDRDRLARKLAFDTAAGTRSLDQLPDAGQSATAAPPYYRTPVPVSYPEYNPELRLDDAAETATSHAEPIDVVPPVAPLPTNTRRGEPIKITLDEVTPTPPPPTQRMPEIRITRDQVTPRPPQVRTGRPVRVPQPTPRGTPNPLSRALRGMFQSEQMKTTKLRVLVQEYPDGPGMYGLQVEVKCKGIKSFVAGTTDRNGRFVCELPVRMNSGLTYDVDVTWPRDEGGETEHKAITLNADRTEFQLPFYRRLNG